MAAPTTTSPSSSSPATGYGVVRGRAVCCRACHSKGHPCLRVPSAKLRALNVPRLWSRLPREFFSDMSATLPPSVPTTGHPRDVKRAHNEQNAPGLVLMAGQMEVVGGGLSCLVARHESAPTIASGLVMDADATPWPSPALQMQMEMEPERQRSAGAELEHAVEGRAGAEHRVHRVRQPHCAVEGPNRDHSSGPPDDVHGGARARRHGRCSRIGTRTHRASSASDARAAQRHARHPRPYRRARRRSHARNVRPPPTPWPPPPSPPHHRPSARHRPTTLPASRATVPHHRRREVGRGPRQARWRRRRTGCRSRTAALALTASAATTPATTRARARHGISPPSRLRPAERLG